MMLSWARSRMLSPFNGTSFEGVRNEYSGDLNTSATSMISCSAHPVSAAIVEIRSGLLSSLPSSERVVMVRKSREQT
ncbi:MAG: hypothetical protein BWY89_01636 [Bacteroidetes bacterium ADurb.BinA012]|nr:MAG: hypothetical protein BWY89_01636 [Bacteroidetes bacterium ADurb.BinA012]